MKNKLLKYYIAAFYFCFTLVLFAQTPGVDDNGNVLEGTNTDTTPMPIDDYVWVLAIVGLLLVYMKFKSIQSKKANS